LDIADLLPARCYRLRIFSPTVTGLEDKNKTVPSKEADCEF
jgi:hypothetical protein